jgi:putative ABC transport system substrate-binding protein
MTGKRLSLLREIRPGLTRVACMNDLSVPSGQAALEELQTAALQLGLQLLSMDVRVEADLEPAFATAMASGAQGLYLGTGGAKYVILLLGQRIVELAARWRVPAVYNLTQFPENGGLMSYGSLSEEIHRRTAYYVDRILRGAKPADLPAEQPSSFEFVVNTTTAHQLGLTFPPNVAAQVTRWVL